jgi:iron complex transport system substrate-binding protein
MAADKKSLTSLIMVLALCGISAHSPRQVSRSADHHIAKPPGRIISVIPAATEILFAIGAGPQVVAVGSFDTFPSEVNKLPKVGALLDPDVERILSLKPDLVVVYASQTDLKQQLGRAGIHIYEYAHAGLADVTATIRALGDVTGHGARARELAAAIELDLAGIRARVKGLAAPPTLLVFGHERGALRGIYASGAVGFLDDMLKIAGGVNVFADVTQQAVQASTEQIIARRPEVILEIRAASGALSPADRAAEARVWNALASLPAVRTGRVMFLVDDRLVIPGPRVAEGTRLMAQALHPEAFR